jgi:hypothetical protein
MIFLLRCLFWLGLVFSQISAQQGSNAVALAGGTARAAQTSAANLSRDAQNALMTAAVRQCRAMPAKCMAFAAEAAEAAPIAALHLRRSRDTLDASDRAPLWRLRSE